MSPGLGWTRGVALLVGLALLIIAAAGTGLGFVYARMVARDRHLTQSYELMSALQQTMMTLQDAELGQRNFLITGRAADQVTYEQARVRLDGLLRQLDAMASTNAGLARRMPDLRMMTARHVNELASSLVVNQLKGREAALEALRSNAERSPLDGIRSVVAGLIEREQLAVSSNVGHVRGSQASLAVIAIAALAACVVFLAGALLLARHGGRQYRTAQRDLAARLQLLETTLETLRDPLAVIDRNGTVVTSNEAFTRLIGWKPEEAHPLTTTALLSDRFPRTRALFQPVATAPAEGQVASRVTADSHDYEVLVERMGDGGLVFRCVDITEKLRTDVALRQGQKMEAVGQLTGGMAHDFNNILQVVQTNLDLLREEVRGNPHSAGHLQSAASAAQRGARLTQQLLAFARRQPLAPLPIDVVRLVKDMAELLRHSLGERITVEFDLAEGIWHIKVDPGQLENAILNLALNARDAMPDGGSVRIDVANATLDRNYALVHADVVPGDYVLVSVTDTGSGMSAEVAARAFDPFFTTKRDGRGTGLGLSMVYGFVQQSGGHIRIDSQPSQGTSVRIYLPRTNEPVAAYFSAERTARSGSERILVVEDNDDVRAAVTAMLEDLGYRVTSVEGPEAALAMLRIRDDFDLLFTDVVMPGQMTGVDLAVTARRESPHLAILLTSGYVMDAAAADALEAFPMISKPYRQEDVATKIRAVLSDAQGRSWSGTPAPSPAGTPPLTAKPAVPQRVLLVEDETLVRMSTTDMLQKLGCEVDAVASGEQALDVLARKGPFDLLIADLGLPGMSGEQLAIHVRQKYPMLRIIIASGYRSSANSELPSGIQFIGKPYSYGDLQQIVQTS